MGYIQGDDRRQQFLLPPSIDEYVDESSPIRVLDAFVDGLDLEESGEKQLLTTDPDARRMHSKDGFHCSYNIQTAVDSENHLICAYEVTNRNTDQGLLNDLCQEAKTALDTPVVEVVADKGYESRRDILDCLMNGNIPHVALKYDKDARVFSLPYREADITDALRARTDPEAIRTCLHAGVLPLAYEDKGVSIEVQSGSELSCFIRHADGTVTCPTGQVLSLLKRNYRGGQVYRNRDACRQCRVRCTKAKVKEVYFGPDTECVAVRVKGCPEQPLQALPEGFTPHNSFYRKDHDDAVVVITIPQDTEKLRTRKCTVEHPFGTIKWYHGAHFALLKGKTKVAGEYALSFLAYNMNRVMKIVGTDALFDLFSDKKRMYELCRLVQ